MKKASILLILLVSIFAKAQSPNKLFEQANSLYQEGNYTKAIEVYNQIEKNQFISEDLYYNLGNCYYKLNQIAPAIYHYEKALKINPANANAKNNLTFANRMKIDVIEALPKTFWQKVSKTIIQKFSYDTWAVLAIISAFLGAILFLGYYFFYSSVKKVLFFNLSIIAFVCFLITTFFAFNNYHTTTNTREGIIFSAKVEVKNAPSEKSDTDFTLHEGTKVFLIDKVNQWQKIKLANGKIGWITKDNLKEI